MKVAINARYRWTCIRSLINLNILASRRYRILSTTEEKESRFCRAECSKGNHCNRCVIVFPHHSPFEKKVFSSGIMKVAVSPITVHTKILVIA